jgi:hypothetical protein
VAGTWAAAKLSDRASFVVPYYHGYAVGASGVIFGLQVGCQGLALGVA